MTKPYHITKEQAWELWVNGGPSSDMKEALQSFANAALDKVLGEPVGKVDDMAAEGCQPMHCFRFNVDAETLPLGTKLYAPRKLT